MWFMSTHKTFEPHVTYLIDGHPVMASVSSLKPASLYRYVCRCGCGEIFERSGAEIQKTVPLVTDLTDLHTHTTVTTAFPTTVTTTTNAAIPLKRDARPNEPTPEEIKLVEAAMDNTVEQERAIEEELVMPTEEPEIGDTVWSKATGKGPYVIIAGTFIDVRAARLEIAQPEDGVYIREKTKTDELLRLDAWLVRDRAGRTSAFPKTELTTVRQFQGPSLIKILLWATTFGGFVLSGWLLHR